ncbi:MAG: hypothetical protein HOY78_17510 [Saccharothrix sp.]|nr:hypothetical protein [Saccharothrix sp.]
MQNGSADNGATVLQALRDLAVVTVNVVVVMARSPRIRWGGATAVCLVVIAVLIWQLSAARPPVAAPTTTAAPTTAVTTTTTVTTTTELPPPPAPTVQPFVPPAPSPASTTTTPAPEGPKIVVSVGDPTSSSSCEKGKCYWIATRLTGFAPGTRYEVTAMGNERDFSEPCVGRTDATGAMWCNTTRYDVPGADVYAYVDTPAGRVVSNTITWP